MNKGKLKTAAKYTLAITALLTPFAVGFTGIGLTVSAVSQKNALKEEITQEYIAYQQDNIKEWSILYANGLITKEEFDKRIQKENSQEAFLLIHDSDVVKEYNKAEDLENKGMVTATAGIAVGTAAMTTVAAVAISKGKKLLKDQEKLDKEIKKHNEELDKQLANINDLEDSL